MMKQGYIYMGSTYEPQFPVSFSELRNPDLLEDARSVPSFRRWRFEMKLSPFFEDAIKNYEERNAGLAIELTRVDNEIQGKPENIVTIRHDFHEKGSDISNLHSLYWETCKLDK